MSNGITIEVFTNTGNNYPPVQVVQVQDNEQPIIVETPQYFAPVQSVNGKIGFVTITQQDLGISGGLVTSGDLSNYATIINLASTGSTLAANLASTGSTLSTNIINLSENVVFKNGDQTINGIKTFSSRPLVNETGVLLIGEIPALPINLVYTDQDQFISGQKTFLISPNKYFWIDNETLSSDHGFLYIDQESASFGYHNNEILFNNSNIEVYGLTNFNDMAQFIGNGAILFVGNGDYGTQLDGNKSGIKLNTFQNPTDITIRSDFVGGNTDAVISVRNQPFISELFGNSINNENGGFGDEIVIYHTGSTYGQSNSEGPFARLGKHNIISEKTESKLGIGTLFPQEKVHVSGGNLRVEGDVFANNLYTKDNPSGFITGVDLSAYATTTNLESTGSTLQTNINNLSSTYATISNLATTGSTLSTNLATTGSFLQNQLTALNISPITVNISNSVTVTNGSFSNTAGMAFNGSGWYGGNVPGWTGPTDSTYAIYFDGSTYYNNLNAGPKGSGTNALRQQVTTSLPVISNITLRFENANVSAFGGVYTINAAIYTTGFQVLASGSFAGAGQKTLIANNVPSGTNCIIAFWGSPQGALTNVSVLQTGIYNTLQFNNPLPPSGNNLPYNSLYVDSNRFLKVV